MTGAGTWWRQSAGELAAALAAGETTAAALLDGALDRIRHLNPDINAVVLIDEAGARRAAEASDARRQAGAALGPLDGLPITIKDNIYVGGLPATWGSALYRDFTPPGDDLPVARLRDAGAVIVGKTNTPEFAMLPVTENKLFGVTRNPWDLSLTPGGSSGGAASPGGGVAALAEHAQRDVAADEQGQIEEKVDEPHRLNEVPVVGERRKRPEFGADIGAGGDEPDCRATGRRCRLRSVAQHGGDRTARDVDRREVARVDDRARQQVARAACGAARRGAALSRRQIRRAGRRRAHRWGPSARTR